MFLKICPLGVSDMINECLPENCNHVNSDMNPRWASLSAATFHSYSSLPLRNFFFSRILSCYQKFSLKQNYTEIVYSNMLSYAWRDIYFT